MYVCMYVCVYVHSVGGQAGEGRAQRLPAALQRQEHREGQGRGRLVSRASARLGVKGRGHPGVV